jgi:hypothetical protein
MNLHRVFLPTLLVMIFALVSGAAFSQKKGSYKASNGFVINVGDTLMLGVGSAPDGRFQHIYESMARTIFASLADEYHYDFRLPEYFQGAPVVIRKIKPREKETLITFNTDGWGSFVIDVEPAIASCEIAYCRPEGFLTQEEFEKLILLYRASLNGEISEERFRVLRNELLQVE